MWSFKIFVLLLIWDSFYFQEISFVTNFGDYHLPESCQNDSELIKFAKEMNKKKVEFNLEEENLVFVTYGSELKKDLELLLESLHVYQFPTIVLGLGQEWRGYGDKLLRLKDFLNFVKENKGEKSLGIPSSKLDSLLIQFVDAYDVLVVNNPRMLELIYESNFPPGSTIFMVFFFINRNKKMIIIKKRQRLLAFLMLNWFMHIQNLPQHSNFLILVCSYLLQKNCSKCLRAAKSSPSLMINYFIPTNFSNLKITFIWII